MQLPPFNVDSLTGAYDLFSTIAVCGMAACVRLIFENSPITPRAIIKSMTVSVFVGVNANALAGEYFKQRGLVIAITSASALCADFIVGAVVSTIRGFANDPLGLLARLLLKMFPSLENIGKVKRETCEVKADVEQKD